ncbi:MAG: hypothetical protein ACD_75C02258G0001 [uncultured bacterium]|nr:MAG: hypothetical protein ACD_75C02258G0001 [uncultured bacterium]
MAICWKFLMMKGWTSVLNCWASWMALMLISLVPPPAGRSPTPISTRPM